MTEPLRAFVVSRTDADTYRRLLAQNSAAVRDAEVKYPIYCVHCHRCGWKVPDLLSAQEAMRRAELHLDDNAECKEHVQLTFQMPEMDLMWM